MKKVQGSIEEIYPYNIAIDLVDGDKAWVDRIYPPGIENALKTLSEREQRVIDCRYRRGLTLRDCEVEFGVTRERIRQIEAKALRKLKHPARMRECFLPSYEKMAELGAEIKGLKEEIGRLSLENTALREIIGNDRKSPFKSQIDTSETKWSNIEIADLELSVRSYNCLSRAGYRTVEDLRKATVNELSRCRNLGQKSLKEIIHHLREYGIELEVE